ncbi:MAG TPA: helix-turn-helix domain-containing protein [Chloroflexia bacterium]|nr:helix-turn-helix domain-containing protein [Chloroflexia bacterium]
MLRDLIAAGETYEVEFKRSGERPIVLAERMAGLANTAGGWIIFGVDDATREIVGVTNAKYASDNIVQAARRCQPPLATVPAEPERIDFAGRTVVVVYVPPASGVLYQAGGVFWGRKGTQTVPMTLAEINALSYARGIMSWEREPTPRATLADLDTAGVERYLSTRPAARLQYNRLADTLVGLQCAVEAPDPATAPQPTNAGLLFFGREPQRLLPQTEVFCVLFRDATGTGGYLDRKNLRGPIPELIDAAERFIEASMLTGARIEGWKRVDLPEYPLKAVREAITNALVHRDYHEAGQHVRIFVYPGQIEVHSPGLLPPGITVSLMNRGRTQSRARNPVLAGLLRDLPGYMEQIGSGIRLMIGAMQEHGLPAPEFREESGEFVVTFYSRRPRPGLDVAAAPPVLVPIAPTAAARLAPRLLELNERQLRAIELVQERGRLTNTEYRALTGMSDRTAARELSDLVNRGFLAVHGSGRARFYTLVESPE